MSPHSSAPTDQGAVGREQSSPSDNLSRAWLVKLVLSLVLVSLVFVVYWPCCQFPFVTYDDPMYISDNTHAQAGLTGESIRWAFTNGLHGLWLPLTWLSLQLDATLYGPENAGAFHRTNMLLHTASTAVLFVVLCRMTAGVWRSAIVAVLFALHPLNVESVAWVAERKNVLSTLFWMLTLAAYLGYVRRPNLGRYLVVLIVFALGLMSKAAVVTLPCVLLLLDYWPLERWRPDRQATAAPAVPTAALRFLILEKLPLFALVLAGCIVTYVVMDRSGPIQPLEKYSLEVRVLNALEAYVIYEIKMLWPMHLAAFYPHPGKAVSVAAGLGSAILLAVVTLLVLWPGRRRPYLAVGWLWYLGTLVPMIGLVQVSDHALADRYAYLPTVGLFLVLAWGGADLAERLHLSIPFRAAAAAAVVILCCILTRIQVECWRSDKALWEHALAVTTDNAFAHVQLGLTYFREGRYPFAEREMKAAVAIDPESPKIQYAHAIVLPKLGRLEEALTAYRKASLGNPEDASLRLRIASASADLLRDLGRNEEALAEYRRAIELDPSYDSLHVGLGMVLTQLGQHKEAEAEFRRAIELNPQSAVAHYKLALALQSEGRLQEAGNGYRKARELGLEQAASQLQNCERMRQLKPRLQGLLAGRDQPSNNEERLDFAQLCGQPFVRCYALAAHLYAEAFRKEPSLADDLRTGLRTAAAIAAARAGCGQGQDSAALKDQDKAQLRRQSLEWLQADLTLWRQWADRPQARTFLMQALRYWQRSDGLSGVREASALARLPENERAAWHKFWQEIESMLRRQSTSKVSRDAQRSATPSRSAARRG